VVIHKHYVRDVHHVLSRILRMSTSRGAELREDCKDAGAGSLPAAPSLEVRDEAREKEGEEERPQGVPHNDAVRGVEAHPSAIRRNHVELHPLVTANHPRDQVPGLLNPAEVLVQQAPIDLVEGLDQVPEDRSPRLASPGERPHHLVHDRNGM
jgi:hypothetical protein